MCIRDSIGMIHIKDLVKYQNEGRKENKFLDIIKREVLEIPPSMPVLDLLLKMQITRLHMGIVIDGVWLYGRFSYD